MLKLDQDKKGVASQKLISKKFLRLAVTLVVKILTLVAAHSNLEKKGTNLTY